MECFACNQVPYFDPATGLVDASCILRPSRTEAAEEAPLDGIDLLTRKEGFLCPISELPATTHYRKNLRTISRGAAIPRCTPPSSCRRCSRWFQRPNENVEFKRSAEIVHVQTAAFDDVLERADGDGLVAC